MWNGGHKYLVTMKEGSHHVVLDLKHYRCACRKWLPTCIPCFHACTCIFLLKKKIHFDYMHECHNRDWYLKIYNYVLKPLKGEKFWEETKETIIFPSKVRAASGRPKKNTTNDVIEMRKIDLIMLKNSGKSVHYTWCKEWGHNTKNVTQKHNLKWKLIVAVCKNFY